MLLYCIQLVVICMTYFMFSLWKILIHSYSIIYILGVSLQSISQPLFNLLKTMNYVVSSLFYRYERKLRLEVWDCSWSHIPRKWWSWDLNMKLLTKERFFMHIL